MGVTGLWRLLEAAGAPVPLETLENKVLAVDISIWLHQMVKGYQDARGAPMPNAHLLGLFQRLCKLLYYRIKPVFVFDGGFPDLKKETIAKRQDHKAKINSESERLKREILLLLGKKTAIGSLLGKQASPKKGQKSDSFDGSSDDIYKLPALEKSQEDVSSESESEDEDASGHSVDLHSVDVNSESFKNLPLKEKHDLLIELKETRKMNSWGKLHELPKNSDNFSDFQMQRLLKRRKVQECLEETEKEIGGNTMSLNELESLLNEEGINTNIESLPTRRIASNENTRFLLINNVKQALEEARKKELAKNKSESAEITEDQKSSRKDPNQADTSNVQSQNIELDEDLQKAIQMSLECVDDVEKAANESEISPDSSFMLDSDYSDTSEENDANYDDYEFSSAKAYIMQNSDLTSNTIKSIINKTVKTSKIKPKPNRVEEILDELSNVPTGCVELTNEVIGQNEHNVNIKDIELSSSDDESIVEVNDFETVNVSSNENEIFSLNSTLEESSVSSDVKSTVSKSKVDSNDKSVVEIQTDEEDQIETLPEKETSSGSFLVKESDIEPFQEKEINSGAFLESGTDSQDTESDDEFEEVPESISTLKPVVQLNLEIKDTIEDDIFADIFENSIETKLEDNNIQVINLTEKPLTDENEKSIVDDINNRKEKIQNIDEDLQKAIELSLRNTEIANKSVIKIDKLKPNEHNSEAEKSSLELPNSETVQHIHEKATIVEDVPTTSYNNEMSKNIEKDNASTDKYSTEELNTIADQLQTEHEDLLQEKSRLDRMGRNITQQMTQDAQELLQIFGIPYIVAPTEAEAQCAFLESVKLTDGTITDDSDIWLFGGKTVYKNFFNQKKHVVQYLAERIEKSFNLSREQLVLLALLVGSDYTTGVNGVGPVTAMEILASFSCSRRDLLDVQTATNAQVKYSALVKGLQEFKRWVRSGKRTDDTSLRKKLKNVTVTDDFPSVRVVQAYMDPKIEKNEEKFTWGDPDVTVLREFTKKKFGWSQSKLDEVLNPVLKRMEQRSQKSIQDYFKRKIQFHSLEDQMSKRVKAAVNRMDPELDPDSLTNMEPPKKVPRKRKATKAKLTDASKVNEEIVESIAEEADERLDKPSTSKSEPKKKSPAIVKSISVPNSETASVIEIMVPKLDRYQEIIPQREKDKMGVLQNKLKAIELFRKSKMDQRKASKKRRVIVPKEKADLSESSDSD